LIGRIGTLSDSTVIRKEDVEERRRSVLVDL